MMSSLFRFSPPDSKLAPPAQRQRRARGLPLAAAFLAALALPISGCKITESISQQFESRDAASAEAAPAAVENQPEPEATEPAQAASRQTVRSTQRMLTALGYDPGVADGIEGPRTADAVRHYQSDYNLPPDGRVSMSLHKHIQATLDRVGTANRNRGESPDSQAKPAASASAERPRSSDPARYELGNAIYEPGDAFAYSNDLVETVERIDGEMIEWQSNQGERFTAYRNFVLPRVNRTSDSETVDASFNAAPDTLWPLAQGTEASFTVTSVVSAAHQDGARLESVRQWSCAVAGKETVKVPAGKFDAVMVTCKATGPSPEDRMQRTWYYAPEIGHYVRVEFSAGASAKTSRDLVAIRPGTRDWPPAARAGLARALQHALEQVPKGESVVWESSSADFLITITPTTPLQKDEKYCRTYQQVRSGAGRDRVYPGLACREPSGKWKVPGLDSEVVARN